MARGNAASTAEAVLEVRAKLDQLRSFIRWTAPLYGLFFVAGLYASRFTFEATLALLVAILAAFAVLDASVLSRIQRLQAAPIRTDVELRTTREQIALLSRTVLVAGIGLGAGFLGVLLWMALRP